VRSTPMGDAPMRWPPMRDTPMRDTHSGRDSDDEVDGWYDR
jgi:hypothetical protein